MTLNYRLSLKDRAEETESVTKTGSSEQATELPSTTGKLKPARSSPSNHRAASTGRSISFGERRASMNSTSSPSLVGAGEPVSAGRHTPRSSGQPIKIVVGIDPYEPSDVLIQTLRAFTSRDVELHLVHGFCPEPIESAAERGNDSRKTLASVRTALETSGLGAAWIERTDDPVQALLDVAEAENADIIAIGSPRHGGHGVARGLLDRSPISLLVARSAPHRPDSLSAVLATDHSDYMKDAVAELCRMNPDGFREIVVLTANELPGGAAAMMVHGLPALASRAEDWISEKLTEENQKVCESLASLGAICTPIARKGFPNEVIASAMKGLDTDLLILGAPHHGRFERFAFGSVSADEILNARYSVLALRP